MRRLTIVTDRAATAQPIPVVHKTERSLSERIQRLQAEAQALAAEHTRQFIEAARHTAGIAQQIAEGGDAYLPGTRELARRTAEEWAAKADTVEAILRRAGR